MNLERVFQNASAARFNSGRRREDHFIEVAEMTSYSRQLGPRRRNGK
jgi:hypothetical protein